MMLRLLIPLLLAFVVAGCTSAEKSKTYQLTIINQSSKPLAAGLIKNGPLEEKWDAPELIAVNAPELARKHWGTAVGAGKTLTIGPQKGHFGEGVVAFARIYAGDLPIEDLVGMSRGNPNRIDIPLQYQTSTIIIKDAPSGIRAFAEDGTDLGGQEPAASDRPRAPASNRG